MFLTIILIIFDNYFERLHLFPLFPFAHMDNMGRRNCEIILKIEEGHLEKLGERRETGNRQGLPSGEIAS